MLWIWIAGGLIGLLALGAGFFFALHLATNEVVPLQRARLLWRWAVALALLGFNLWIWGRVILGLIAVW